MNIKFHISYRENSSFRYIFSSRYILFWISKENKVRFSYMGYDSTPEDSRSIPENFRFFSRLKY